MDIAKYTGLFLLQNEYCYLPGIGSFSIEKKRSSYNTETGEMQQAEYFVEFDQNYGAIDDSFAEFIAENERISIAHGSNYLKEFCASAKKELIEGKKLDIPAIGSLIMDNAGVITFNPDPHLKVEGKSIPLFKNSAELEEKRKDDLTNIIESTEIRQPKSDEEIIIKPPKVNWLKIILLGVVALGILGGIGYFVWNFINTHKEATDTEQSSSLSTPVDSTNQHNPDSSTLVATADSVSLPTTNPDTFLVAINQYPTLVAANKRATTLKNNGNSTRVWAPKDSSTFYVVIPVPSKINQDRAVDSLKRFFNPNGEVKVVGN